MKLVGREKLFERNLNKSLNNWLAEIKEANWKVADEVKSQFPRVVQIDGNKFLYPVGDKNVSVEFLIAFAKGIVLITDIVKVDQYGFAK